MSFIENVDDHDRKVFYKALATKSLTEAACEIGFDKVYSKTSTLRAKAHQLLKSINQRGPDTLGLSHDIVEVVRAALEERKAHGLKNRTEVYDRATIDPTDTKEVIVGGRNKAAMLLHQKMDRLAKNKKLLDATTLTQLATTFGIFFDKSQILLGQATENIAIHAKIKDNMSPEESLEALLKMREVETNVAAAERKGS